MSNTVTTKATGKIDSRRVSPSARVHKEEGGEREWDTPKNSYRKGGSERMDMEDKYPGTRNMPDEA